MRISCPVCQEVLCKDFCCAPCGHIFHHECLMHWLDMKKPSSCPQCRRPCPTAKVIRLFVEEHVDVDIDPNLGSDELRESLKRALEKVKSLEQDMETLRTELTEVNDRHDKTVIDLQAYHIETSDLKKETYKLKKAADRADLVHQKNIALAEQVRSLTGQLQASESMSTVLQGSISEVADVVKTYRNCENSTEQLATFLVATKKEFERLKGSYKDACNVKDRQAKMLAVEKSKYIEYQKKLTESQAARESLEGELRSLEAEKDALNVRFDKLASRLVNVDSKPAIKRKRPEPAGPSSPVLVSSQSSAFSPTASSVDFEDDASPPPKKALSKVPSAPSGSTHNEKYSKTGRSSFGDLGRSADRFFDDDDDMDFSARRKVESSALPVVRKADTAHTSGMHGLLLKSQTASQMSSIRKGYNGFGGHSKFHVHQPAKDGNSKSSLKFGQKVLSKPKVVGAGRASGTTVRRTLYKENAPPLPNLLRR